MDLPQINFENLKITVANSKQADEILKNAAQNRANQVFEQAVEELQQNFEESPITLELEGGIESKNISNTLMGGDEPESLYAFIGFPRGENPTQIIREQLNINVDGGPQIKFAGKESGKNVYKFEISAPDLIKIYEKTPLPWAPGLSWAEGIEKGIPGFNHFLAFFTNKSNSRSGGGLQVKNEMRGNSYIPPAYGYLSNMVDDFLMKIRQYHTQGFRRNKR